MKKKQSKSGEVLRSEKASILAAKTRDLATEIWDSRYAADWSIEPADFHNILWHCQRVLEFVAEELESLA